MERTTAAAMMTTAMAAMRRIIDTLRGERFGELLRYAVIGVLTTLVGIGSLALTTDILPLPLLVGNLISNITAILFAYVTNKLIVFRSKCPDARALWLEFVKFIGARLITMALDEAVVWLLVIAIGLDKYIGKISALVLVIIANYILSKLLVFRARRDGA
ncbi:MAG: GtrA family protein [Oscillospiraceae bacterium]|jgi:putative flippase GtrA|nr:GtrA family protein [Oscillospiraceae bacterium]